MPLLHLKFIGALLIAAALFGAYHWVGSSAVDEYKAEQKVLQDIADAKQREKYEELEAELIVAKASKKIIYKTITKTVDRLVDRPEYHVPCMTQEGMDAANNALSGSISNELF